MQGSEDQSDVSMREWLQMSSCTHAGQRNATVTALGGSCRILDVVVDQLAAGRLDDTTAVRGRVVRVALAERDALGHFCTDSIHRVTGRQRGNSQRVASEGGESGARAHCFLPVDYEKRMEACPDRKHK